MAEELLTNQEEGVCPNCGGFGYLEYECDKYYLDGDYLVFPFACEKCGFKGEELNSLVFEQNREATCLDKDNKKGNGTKTTKGDDAGGRKEKAQSSFNRRNMQRQLRQKVMSDFKPVSTYLGFAGRYLSMRQYKQRREQQTPSLYARDYKPSRLVIPYRPITAKLPKVYQKFLRAAKKTQYLRSGVNEPRAYGKQQGGKADRLGRDWYRSLESYLNKL